MTVERSERKDKWIANKLQEADEHHRDVKRTAYYCTIMHVSSRSRDGLLSASNLPVSGSEVRNMLKQIDEEMERFLLLKCNTGIDCAYISPIQLVEMVVEGTGYDKPALEVVFSGDGRQSGFVQL
jgi:hypothetical protein